MTGGWASPKSGPPSQATQRALQKGLHVSTQTETSTVVHKEMGTRNGSEAQGRGKRPRGVRVTESGLGGWVRTAVWEARCPPPPGAGHAPGSSDPVTDLLCQVNDILPALGGNGPSPQSCLFFLNLQTQAAQEWAVYGLCARPRWQAIRNAELHVPRAQTRDWRLQRACPSPRYTARCHSVSSFLKPPHGRQRAVGGAGGPA